MDGGGEATSAAAIAPVCWSMAKVKLALAVPQLFGSAASLISSLEDPQASLIRRIGVREICTA